MAKFEERIKARDLRSNGESIRTIAKKLSVSKSSVGLWCEDIELTKEQINKLIEDDKKGGAVGRAKAAVKIRNERLRRLSEHMDKGKKLVSQINKRDLFIAGIALYWAEGNKKNRETKFVNSDPSMIKLWIEWLIKFAGVKKENLIFRIGINQEHKLRIDDVTNYWLKIVKVKKSQFRHPSFKKVVSHKVYANFEDHYGSLMVAVRRGTNLNYQILGMIDAIKNFEAEHDKI